MRAERSSAPFDIRAAANRANGARKLAATEKRRCRSGRTAQLVAVWFAESMRPSKNGSPRAERAHLHVRNGSGRDNGSKHLVDKKQNSGSAPWESSESARRAVLFKLALRFGWVCWYCNAKLSPATATIDHVIPRCGGGPHDEENLALACEFCQRAKWDRTLTEFLRWLRFVRDGDSLTWLKDYACDAVLDPQNPPNKTRLFYQI
jgi:5-methylcytosine-specific restriction endonuclease McrA